jgi:hypothetical protein
MHAVDVVSGTLTLSVLPHQQFVFERTVDVTTGQAWSCVKTAIYVVCDPHRIVRYVGSVAGDDQTLAARIRHHVRTRDGAPSWTQLTILPLYTATPQRLVRQGEGLVGRVLDPLDNEKLPAVPGMPSWTPAHRRKLS